MSQITAQLNNLRQSPRKVRVVADLVRGKKASDAILTLQFASKRASLPIAKLIASAVANAKAQSIETDDLVVKKIEVNPGATLYRRRPAPHGSAHPIRKRTSRIFVLLSGKADATTDVAAPSSVEKKTKPKADKKPTAEARPKKTSRKAK